MHIELRDSLEFFYPDSLVEKNPCSAMTIDVARGATASVHVLINDVPEGKTLRIALRNKRRLVKNARWFRLIHVPVETNTGPVGFIEKDDERNDNVIRRAPFRVYDAIEPVDSTFKVTSSTMALRLHLPVPVNAHTGIKYYTLEIAEGEEYHELALTVNTHIPVIPSVGKTSFPYTNWFSLDSMAKYHNLKPWSEKHWQMIGRYAELMVHARQNTFWCPLNDIFEVKNGDPLLNRKRLERLVNIFTDAGMYYIESGHFAERTGGEWKSPTFDLTLMSVHATSADGNKLIHRISSQLMEVIDRNGWRERWIQHVADEPIEVNVTDYRLLVGMIRKYMPGIPILDATVTPAIPGSMDIWCPLVNDFQKHRKQFEAQRALGDRVWFYTCCFPGGPWLNRFLDMELLRPALYGWGAALYGLQGFLHWGLNHYQENQNPFIQSVVLHKGSFLPAGDTHIVYPGNGKPWSSLRLEAQREGFEDYELLHQLLKRNSKQAKIIIRKAIRRFDQYTKKVKVFRAARKAMLEALETGIN